MSTLAALAAELAQRSDAQLAQLFSLRPDAIAPPVATFADLASRLSSADSINLALNQLTLPELQSLAQPSAAQSQQWLPALHERALVIGAPPQKDDGGTAAFLPLATVTLALGAGPAAKLDTEKEAAPIPAASAQPMAKTFPVSQAVRDNAAGSAIESLLRGMTAVVELAEHTPVGSLHDGTVSVRALKTLSRVTAEEEALVCFYLELAAMTELIYLDKKRRQWLAAAGDWRSLGRPAQWLMLAQAWLDSDRRMTTRPLAPAGLQQDAPASEAETRSVHARYGRSIRQNVLSAVVKLASPEPTEPGQTDTQRAAPAPALSAITELSAWRHPRQSQDYAFWIPAILREMEVLGITGAGVPSGPGLALNAGITGTARTAGTGGPTNSTGIVLAALADLLPEPIERFVLQGDLTAIAPGFLAPPISAALRMMAVPEGQGAAGIFRFSQASLESALAAGMSPGAILAFLQEHSSTAVPQSLDYLIAAAARRTEAEAVPASVAAQTAKPRRRESGVVRTPRRGPDPKDIAAQITQLRSQPVWGGTDSGEAGPALIMEELRQAITAGSRVRLRVVTGAGHVERVELWPISLEAGSLRTRLAETGDERRFSIHRIMTAEVVEQAEGTGHG